MERQILDVSQVNEYIKISWTATCFSRVCAFAAS